MDFGDLGRRCVAYKNTRKGRRCAAFAGADDLGMFGDGGRDHIAGPLIGGGIAQVGLLATKLLFKDSPKVVKWAPSIGTALSAIVGGIMAFRPNTRATGISALVTAGLIGIPRQIEGLLEDDKPLRGYLGVTVAERELADAMEQEAMAGMGGFGAGDVELLDSGGGSSAAFGVHVAERELEGSDLGQGAGPGVELLGSGFGSNFLSSQ